MQEARPSPVVENLSTNTPEPLSDENFEDSVLLKDFFEQARNAGLLSTEQYKLLLKFKGEGLVWKELGDGENGPSAMALYRRVKRTIYRLRRAQGREGAPKSKASAPGLDFGRAKPQKNFARGGRFLRVDVHLVIVRRDSHRSFPARYLKTEPMGRSLLCDIRSTETRYRSHPLT